MSRRQTLYDLDQLYIRLAARCPNPGVWDAYSRRFVVMRDDEVTFYFDLAQTQVAARFILKNGRWWKDLATEYPAQPDEG